MFYVTSLKNIMSISLSSIFTLYVPRFEHHLFNICKYFFFHKGRIITKHIIITTKKHAQEITHKNTAPKDLDSFVMES